ncbi:MAG: phage tail assembly protein [Asticcacaulis sp.]
MSKPVFKSVALGEPVVRGDTAIAALQLRRPNAGELRGISLVELSQLQVSTLVKIIPRLSDPVLTEAECEAMAPSDIMTVGVEIASFLLPKEAVSDSRLQ